MHKHKIGCIALIFVVSLMASHAYAQVATGVPPFSSFASGPFDTIDLANLNVHFSIPVFSRAGRGLPFSYALQYDGSIWNPVVNPDDGSTNWTPATNWGWKSQADARVGYVTYKHPNFSAWFANWKYIDASGTSHTFPLPTLWTPASGATPNSGTATATDGSGYTIFAQVNNGPSVTIKIYTPGGATIIPPQQDPGAAGTYTMQDSNGNVVTASTSSNQTVFTDTLGTTALTISSFFSPPFRTTYTYSAPNGSTATLQVNYALTSVRTNFGVPGIQEFSQNGILLVTSIALPDGSGYGFTYEPTPGNPGFVTGRIASVTLPTGGSIAYRYAGGSNGIFGDGTTAGFYRDVYDGTNTNTWLYFLSGSGLTTIYDPQSNLTQINFSGIYETQRKMYKSPNNSSDLLKTILICYNGNFATCDTPPSPVTPPITSKFLYDIFPSGLADAHVGVFNSNGLPTEIDDYDFTTGSFGAATSRKLITYAGNLGNIVDRPASVIVEDGASTPTIFAQTNFSYDETAPTATSGTPQHVAVSGSRGNVTTISQWVQGTTFLTKHFSYYDTGTPNTIADVNGAVTTVNYGTDLTANCGNSFPVSVSPSAINGITLTTSTAYDCNGGVAVSSTDPNGNSKSVVTWDPNFWRPTSLRDELGFVTNIAYTSPTVTESSFNFNGGNSTIYTRTTLDGLGRTHIVQRKQSPTATTYDSMQTDYDSLGRPFRTSNAYVAAAGQGFPTGTPVTTTSYDALSRPTLVTDAGNGTVSYSYTDNDVFITVGPAPTGENAKQRQYEYDALGRLTSVCEVTSGGGSGTCAQNTNKTGYWTKYAYDPAGRLLTVTQNAQASGSQQTRTFTYDGLSRMLSETNPETGTISSFYDSDSTCGQVSAGDMVRHQNAMGQFDCYAYDALHRVTGIGHYGANNGSNTPNVALVYDAATVNGVSMANAKGRLARTYTCLFTCTPLMTDEGFSYSARGETTDVYESTLHSNGYYHVTASYWEHGALRNWTMPGVPTITYGASDGSGLDGEGRITKVMAATGINPVNSVSYNNIDPGTSNQPLGALLSVSLGTTTTGQYDTDSFSYDKNTGRLTQYASNVNGGSNTGTLAWNANGSLQQLQIAGNLISDFQTCNYTHDDLGRIATVNCSEGNPLGMFFPWAQNFSYDPFGNITKTVPQGGTGLAFQVSYNQANNRISSTGYSYDANGNLLTDATGSHSYGWDADGRPACIDGVTLIYDGAGRAVEQAAGGTCASPGTNYKQIVYGPGGGKLALMSAQTLIKAFVPLPGGATAIYTSSGLAYYRHPNYLGSSVLASTPSRTIFSAASYAPFGENYNGTGTADLSFTGQNQDTVTGLYDFMFREYSPNQGRWISPDPAGLAAVSLTNPETWNRYTYVANSPTEVTDPLGLWCGRSGSYPCHTREANGSEWGGGVFGSSFDMLSMYGGGGGCNLDGGFMPCHVVGAFIGSGAAVNCPQCKSGDRVDANNHIWRLYTELIWITNGYYNPKSAISFPTMLARGWTDIALLAPPTFSQFETWPWRVGSYADGDSPPPILNPDKSPMLQAFAMGGPSAVKGHLLAWELKASAKCIGDNAAWGTGAGVVGAFFQGWSAIPAGTAGGVVYGIREVSNGNCPAWTQTYP